MRWRASGSYCRKPHGRRLSRRCGCCCCCDMPLFFPLSARRGVFFFHPERSEGKNGPPGDKEEGPRARGKDREAGRASAKQPYRLARSRAVPKGRPGAKRSGHPRPWEWINDARPSASERLFFALQHQASGRAEDRIVSGDCNWACQRAGWQARPPATTR